MVSRLRPLDVDFSFPEKPYQLGDSVRVDLQMTPRRDVLIRTGRIDLVCSMTFSEIGRPGPRRVGTNIPVTPASATSTLGGRGSHYKMVPSEASVEVTETDSYRGEPFLEGRRLRSGSRVLERVIVDVPAELPEEVGGSRNRTVAELEWSLVLNLDIGGARDVTLTKPIDIRHVASSASMSPAALEWRRQEAREAAQRRWDDSQGSGRSES